MLLLSLYTGLLLFSQLHSTESPVEKQNTHGAAVALNEADKVRRDLLPKQTRDGGLFSGSAGEAGNLLETVLVLQAAAQAIEALSAAASAAAAGSPPAAESPPADPSSLTLQEILPLLALTA